MRGINKFMVGHRDPRLALRTPLKGKDPATLCDGHNRGNYRKAARNFSRTIVVNLPQGRAARSAA